MAHQLCTGRGAAGEEVQMTPAKILKQIQGDWARGEQIIVWKWDALNHKCASIGGARLSSNGLHEWRLSFDTAAERDVWLGKLRAYADYYYESSESMRAALRRIG